MKVFLNCIIALALSAEAKVVPSDSTGKARDTPRRESKISHGDQSNDRSTFFDWRQLGDAVEEVFEGK